MPPSITTDPGLTVTTFPTQTVETIAYLGAPGGWTVVPHLYCDRLRLAVNAYDEANLSYAIGEGVVQPGASTFADYQPLALRGKFVRVTIVTTPSNIVWVGYVLADETIRDAVKNVGGVNKLVGQSQVVSAVGLEYFLDRKQIDSAVIRVTGETPNYVRIQRALTFNGGPTAALDPGSAVRGNRSSGTGGAGVYDFSDSFDGAPLWSARQIVDHLLEYHTMRDSFGGVSPCLFALHGDDTSFLEGFYPTLRSEGLTIFEALNKLCAPTRGLVWWTEYTEVLFPKLLIRVQSAAVAAVALPAGGTLPANNNQETLDFDGELDVRQVKLSQLGHRDYHQVVARGARMTSTMTVGMPDNTLIADWSQLSGPADAGIEKKYKEGAKNDFDYGGLDDTQKKKRNDAFRRNDAFYRVYSCFRIPTNWDGKTGDGGTGQRGFALPLLSPTGSVLGSLVKNVQGLRMLNTLRLKRGWDYRNPSAPKSATPTGTLAELAPAFAFFRVATSPDRFQFCDKLGQADFALGSPESSKIETSYHLHMQQGVPGIRLTASGGMPHAMAKSAWAGAELSETKPEVDYATLRATVCVEADAFAEGKYPEAGFPANTPLEILQLEVGEQYRLDFLAANTVVLIENGQLVLASHAAVLRDDHKYLQDVARLAYEWYQIDRNTLSVTFRQVRNLFELGMLITAIGSGTTQKNVNTVISTLTFDMLDGSTQLETNDATLDARSAVV